MIHDRLNYHFHKLRINSTSSYLTIFDHLYVKSISESFALVASKLNSKTAYTIPSTFKEFIWSEKDKLDMMSRQDVVYKISCYDHNSTYVGQTKRKLQTRIAELWVDINKTNRLIFCYFQPSHHNREFNWNNI